MASTLQGSSLLSRSSKTSAFAGSGRSSQSSPLLLNAPPSLSNPFKNQSFFEPSSLRIASPAGRSKRSVCCSAQSQPAAATTTTAAAAAGGATVTGVGKVSEVDIKTFDQAMAEAGHRLVVLDMYTQWCGPCKLIAPKINALAQTFQDVVFLKLDCNQENKPLAKSLGVRSVPTFKLLRDSKTIAEVVGAKLPLLLDAIITHHTTPEVGDTVAARVGVGKVAEVCQDTFYPALQQAGKRLVVLDMYTDWCGPCKQLQPVLEEAASANPDLVFLKLNCNEENKPLAKALGVISVPTVKFFKSYELLDEVRGLKVDLIMEKMQQHT